jgi:Subtilase family/Peptidase inhibitor I9
MLRYRQRRHIYLAGTLATALAASGLTASAAIAAASGPKAAVIVVLRDQHLELPAKSAAAARQQTTAREQAPLVSSARSAGATNVKNFSIINGFSATMTAAEADNLRADPSVAEVVPDRMVPISPLTAAQTAQIKAESAQSRTVTTVTAPPDHIIPGTCPSDPGKPLLEPEALQTTNTAFSDPTVPQAQNLVTGKGVTVAWIADGLDPNNPDFIRADGTHVFTDYEDFSGTDPSLGGAGGEAFGDASSIASQGRQVYDLSKFVNAAHPLPPGCNITVRGMAPGASLVGLNVFGSSNFAINSSIIQAIDFAVNMDHVDVINESFGGNAYPTDATDPTALADDAAVAAGITVVSSSGDAGPTNTQGSPSVDPNVISAGATTTFRVQAQTGYAGTRNFATSWASNNASPISSDGVNDRGRVIDLVAPGQDGWAICTPNPVRFANCTAFNNTPSPIEDFGGTSESSPLIAGASALVIEAYKNTHGGVRPSPALVKQILTSTATDLGLPASEQGAGEVNSLRAVQMAMSIQDTNGSPAMLGNGLMVTGPGGDTQLTAVGGANHGVGIPVTVTNTGPSTQTVSAHGRILGKTLSDLKATIPLDISSASTPSFLDGINGAAGPVVRRFAETTFTVPAGADHLEGQLSWPGGGANGQSLIRLALIGPNGEYETHSLPQGAGNHGQVDVRFPAAGTWTAVFFASASPAGFHGTVNYEFTTTKYTNFASVSPAGAVIKPGQSATFQVHATLPEDAGDLSAAIQFSTSLGAQTAIPLTLRTLLGSEFVGTLTGGNGRGNPGAQTQAYFFDVPSGKKNLGIDLTLNGTPNQHIFAALEGPDRQVLSLATNQSFDASGNPIGLASLQGIVRAPMAGRWTLFIDIDNPVAGNTLTERFVGHLRYDLVQVHAGGLPHGTIAAGTVKTATITVTNTGKAPAQFFADPRLTTSTVYPLLVQPGSDATISLPFPATAVGPVWLVPTESTDLSVQQSSTIPADFDASYLVNGVPEILGIAHGLTASADLTASRVTQGLFSAAPTPLGPTNGPVSGSATLSAQATTQTFDPNATSSTGDLWSAANNLLSPAFAPISLNPGQSGTITVAITAAGASGATVSGVVYVDTFSSALFSGDDIAALPYTYTVK